MIAVTGISEGEGADELGTIWSLNRERPFYLAPESDYGNGLVSASRAGVGGMA